MFKNILLVFDMFMYDSLQFVTAFMMSKASGLKYGEYVYPDWSNILGWLLASSTLVPIPCFMVYKLLQYDGSFVQVCIYPDYVERNWVIVQPQSSLESMSIYVFP